MDKSIKMNLQAACLYCKKKLTGRIDKKYCDTYCKSAYQYQKAKQRPASFYTKVDKQLRLNRRLLKTYNKAGKSVIRAETLVQQGFDPMFFTHYWKNTKGAVYFFVYEYGFLKKKERGRDKYVLVIWQPFMERTIR